MSEDFAVRRTVQNCLAEMAQELDRPTEDTSSNKSLRAADAFLRALDRAGMTVVESEDRESLAFWLRPVEPG